MQTPSPSYLLDTNVLLHLTRGSKQATTIEALFNLKASPTRPMICEVSLGEMLAFSSSLNWGEAKRSKLAELQKQLVLIDISDPLVMSSYAELSSVAKKNGWSIFHGKNDLWIGAAARAAGAHLLTMDSDFLPVRDQLGWPISVLSPTTGQPV